MPSVKPFYVLQSRATTFVIRCQQGKADILYWSPLLACSYADQLSQLAYRPPAPVSEQQEAPLSLSPEFGAAYLGDAGIQVHRQGQQWATNAKLVSVLQNDDGLSLFSRCDATHIEVVHTLKLDYNTSVLSAKTTITNLAEQYLDVLRCNAPCIVLPNHVDQITGFEGCWGNEFQTQQVEKFSSSYVRENRSGRTSHHTFPGLLVHDRYCHEQNGEVYGFHLGWSGNHRSALESTYEGRSNVQMGELFFPGELGLGQHQSYTSPTLYGSFSGEGFSALSRNFHHYVRANLTAERMLRNPKPVHFNTWEATYFELDAERLYRLANQAADLGVERFVLDDGWFTNRRNDKAGLGDWSVDPEIFPNGLHDLIEHVTECGMELGLWVEPEMVSPDSDLYGKHPDWVLLAPGQPLRLERHQLVLDLSRPEVCDYLYERLHGLLKEYPQITYLKWTMSRDISQPVGHDGAAAVHKHVTALYRLLEQLRAEHPLVEIETSASGGGRVDYGILNYTDRVWVSDSNDAIDRLRIQRGFSFFFPPEFMGVHVGSSLCHTTGRRFDMAMRAGVAMMGDMGVEANILEMSDLEKSELTAAITLHKQYRKLIFSGEYRRLNSHNGTMAFGIVSADKREALFQYAQLETYKTTVGGRLHLEGLQANRNYLLQLVWPTSAMTPATSVINTLHNQQFSGESLMKIGMQLPVLKPASLFVIALTALQ